MGSSVQRSSRRPAGQSSRASSKQRNRPGVVGRRGGKSPGRGESQPGSPENRVPGPARAPGSIEAARPGGERFDPARGDRFERFAGTRPDEIRRVDVSPLSIGHHMHAAGVRRRLASPALKAVEADQIGPGHVGQHPGRGQADAQPRVRAGPQPHGHRAKVARPSTLPGPAGRECRERDRGHAFGRPRAGPQPGGPASGRMPTADWSVEVSITSKAISPLALYRVPRPGADARRNVSESQHANRAPGRHGRR